MNHHLLSFVRLEKAIAPHRTGEVTCRLPFLAVPEPNIQYFLPLIKKFFSYIEILFTFSKIIIIFLIGWLPAERIKRKYKSFILSFHPKNIVFPDKEKTLVLYISYLVAILFILKNKPYSFKSYRSRAHNASLYFTVS